ncbi:MAG: hypothetical protein IAE95_13635, partial [Chitinophagaceae bacterium]|nr:hypothetical protein [Chitinophagaceae bacterium]
MTDIENEMKEITSVLMNTQENFRVFDYLTSKIDDKDAHTVVHRSMYFAFTKNMLFDQIILGLSFLYKPKERHNLRTFINKFREGGVFATKEIDRTAIKQWQKKIKLQDAIIDQIIVVRNSMVAHKEEKKLETSGLTKKNFSNLITIAQSIFQDIYEKLYNSEYRIDKPF